MDKNSKILFAVFFLAVFTATGISFYKYYILKDFYIMAEKNCDPKEEKCFMRECYTASDANCPEEGEKRTVYYTLITKNASTIQDCDPKYPDCDALDCKEEKGCVETLCDGEDCSDPETYIKSVEQDANY